MPVKRTFIMTAAVMLEFSALADAADLDGRWARGDGNANVRIAPCGSNICAINTWIKPGTPREKAGDRLVMTIKPAGTAPIPAQRSILSGT